MTTRTESGHPQPSLAVPDDVNKPSPWTIGALIFPGFETLDLFGPIEMFGTVDEYFAISLVAKTQSPVQSRHGHWLIPDRIISDNDCYDLILVPGGPGTPLEKPVAAIDDWLIRQVESAKLVLSVCTGSALLARNGLLDGRRATTNKLAFDWVRKFGPNVDWAASARWVRDGKFFTSSGVSAGMDMALAVIDHLVNRDAAERVTLITEYLWHKDPESDPFSAFGKPI